MSGQEWGCCRRAYFQSDQDGLIGFDITSWFFEDCDYDWWQSNGEDYTHN